MANWSNPQLTSTYTNFVTEVKDRDVDLALQFDGTTSTNLPTGTIRWSSSANRWQKWTGSAWGELTGTYALTGLSTTGAATIGGNLSTTGGGTITSASTVTGTAFIPSGNTAPSNGVYLPATNALGFATNGTPQYYIDSDGNLLYGRSTARTDVSGRLQLEGTGNTSANILLARNQNIGASTATLNFVKNHAASTTNTALPALSYLGQIGFWGANGTSYVRGVTIYAYADGAWSGSTNPTGINIDTTGGGRISLGSTGNFTLFNFGTNNTPVNFNGSAPNNALVLDASGNVNIDSGTFYVDAVNNRVGIGTSTPGSTLHVEAAGNTVEQRIFTSDNVLNATASLTFGTTPGSRSKAAIRLINSNTGNASGDLALLTNDGSTLQNRLYIDSSGRLLVGATSDSGGALLQVNGDRIRVATAKTPASATAAGTAGEVCWDTNYIYVCTATNTWKRAAIATW